MEELLNREEEEAAEVAGRGRNRLLWCFAVEGRGAGSWWACQTTPMVSSPHSRAMRRPLAIAAYIEYVF